MIGWGTKTNNRIPSIVFIIKSLQCEIWRSRIQNVCHQFSWHTQIMSSDLLNSCQRKKGFPQLKKIISYHTENSSSTKVAEAEFKELEPRLKIWDAAQIWLVALKIVFNISRLKPVFGGFATRLKFIKFGLGFTLIQLMEVVQLDQNSFNVSYS